MTEPTINSVIAEISARSGALLQFYVVRHVDYPFLAGKMVEGDDEAAIICGTMTSIAQGMTDQAASCMLCDHSITFMGSSGIAIVGPSPIIRGSKCVFRLLCAKCADMPDADLMLAVTDRWRVLVKRQRYGYWLRPTRLGAHEHALFMVLIR